MTSSHETTKTFSALAIGSLTSGIALRDRIMSEAHEAIEHILGHPVWLHELGSKEFQQKVRTAVATAYPDFPVEKPSNWLSLVSDLKHRFPDGITLPFGTCERDRSPMDTLKGMIGDKPVAVIEVDR